MVPLPTTMPVALRPAGSEAQARPGPAPVVSLLDLGEIVRARPAREVAVAFADLADALALRLAEAPGDYLALVGLGELWLRTGRAGDAKPLLERATAPPPPSWEAYQYRSALRRPAEIPPAREFSPASGPAH